MEFESRTQKTQRITKTILQALGFMQIQEFVDSLPNVNYMQVYNALNGRLSRMNEQVVRAILDTYPEVNPDFLEHGEGEPLLTSTPNASEAQSVSTDDIFHLLERITLLLEKVQAREDNLIEREAKINERMARLEELEKRILEHAENDKV